MTGNKNPAQKKPRPLGRPHKAEPGDRGLRERIMEEAVKIFSRKGVAASSLKEISQAAGATPAVIYYHFESRENLVVEALDTHFLPLIERVWAVVDEKDDPLELITQMQKRLLANALEVPWFLDLWGREFANAGGSLREYTARRLPPGIVRRMAVKIRKGQKEGRINPDLSPEMVYMSIIGETLIPLKALDSWTHHFEEGVELKTVIKHVSSMLAHGFKGKMK